MRNYVVEYEDNLIGRPGEVYQSDPFLGPKAREMAKTLEVLGCTVLRITPVTEEIN